ncbi:acyl carrier protein [Streptomyces lydicus]
MASDTDIRCRISAYLARFFPVHEIEDDDDFFQLGFVNSMFAMQIVAFIEHEFDITLEDEDLVPANFRSIRALENFINGKLGASAAR